MGKAPQTAFQKIAYFNTLIGNSNAADLSGLKAQFHCIKEEFLEMEHALNEYIVAVERCEAGGNDGGDVAEAGDCFIQLRDGIADVLVTTYGLAHRAGIDADWDLDLVYESNMSKFIKGTIVDAQAAGAEIHQRTGLRWREDQTASGIWAITSGKNQHGEDGKFYPEGKLLKPAQFREPDFTKVREVIEIGHKAFGDDPLVLESTADGQAKPFELKTALGADGQLYIAGIGAGIENCIVSDDGWREIQYTDHNGRQVINRYHKSGWIQVSVDGVLRAQMGPL
jgi:predicted HAD superfamily Cof-like phosphohydrolase